MNNLFLFIFGILFVDLLLPFAEKIIELFMCRIQLEISKYAVIISEFQKNTEDKNSTDCRTIGFCVDEELCEDEDDEKDI